MIFLWGRETTPTQVKYVVHLPPPPNCCNSSTRKEGRGRSAREREREMRLRGGDEWEEDAKENAHTAQCATSMDIRKRKQPFSLHLTYLPTYLPACLPSF